MEATLTHRGKWVKTWEVPSSDGEKTYKVSVDEHGNYGCSCPVWKFRRQQCKHIEYVLDGHANETLDSVYRTEPVNKPYFTMRKAKNLITTSYWALTDSQLQNAIVMLRDYVRFIETHGEDKHSFESLLNGGYFKQLIDPYVSGLVPADMWLYTNLTYTLDEAIKEREKRKEEQRKKEEAEEKGKPKTLTRRQLVRWIIAKYIKHGYLYSGCVHPNEYQFYYNHDNYELLLDLEHIGFLVRRNCKGWAFELPINVRYNLIKKYNLSYRWEKDGACFDPNGKYGEVQDVVKAMDKPLDIPEAQNLTSYVESTQTEDKTLDILEDEIADSNWSDTEPVDPSNFDEALADDEILEPPEPKAKQLEFWAA